MLVVVLVATCCSIDKMWHRCYIAYAMSDQLNPQTTKPSKLEEFKLFYEAVPAPAYLGNGRLESEKKGPAVRDRRLTRRRR